MSSSTNGTSPATSSSNGVSDPGGTSSAGEVSLPSSGEDRLRQLEVLFGGGLPEGAHTAKAFSTETLLDILLVLYNECCNSSLRKEKTLTDFIELGETIFQLNIKALKSITLPCRAYFPLLLFWGRRLLGFSTPVAFFFFSFSYLIESRHALTFMASMTSTTRKTSVLATMPK